MSRARVPGSLEHIQLAQPFLWVVAIAFFGVGDVVTTSTGLRMAAVHEAGPVSGVFLDRYGPSSMIVVKFTLFGGFYTLWKISPRDYRAGVPLGLAILGVCVVWWNLLVQVLAITS